MPDGGRNESCNRLVNAYDEQRRHVVDRRVNGPHADNRAVVVTPASQVRNLTYIDADRYREMVGDLRAALPNMQNDITYSDRQAVDALLEQVQAIIRLNQIAILPRQTRQKNHL